MSLINWDNYEFLKEFFKEIFDTVTTHHFTNFVLRALILSSVSFFIIDILPLLLERLLGEIPF